MQPLEAASGTWMFVCEAFFSTENNLQLGYGVIYWFLSLQLLGSEERRSASVCPAAERSQGWGQTCQTSYCVQPDSAGVQTSPLHPGYWVWWWILCQKLGGWPGESFVILCTCEGAGEDQAGPVHPGGACLTRGPVDTGACPALAAALLRVRDGNKTIQGTHRLKTWHDSPDWLFN